MKYIYHYHQSLQKRRIVQRKDKMIDTAEQNKEEGDDKRMNEQTYSAIFVSCSSGYSEDVFEAARKAGATGVVFGILTPDGHIDTARTRHLVEAAEGMETTFHRAVDMTADYLQAVEYIISTGCTRILTSGGYDKATEGISNITHAVILCVGRIEIMAGSGVSSSNALLLASTGIDALHFSAKRTTPSGMTYRNPRISMGGTEAVDEFALRTVDEEEVRKILKVVREQAR